MNSPRIFAPVLRKGLFRLCVCVCMLLFRFVLAWMRFELSLQSIYERACTLRTDVPLKKGEYITAAAMNNYEEGQRAAILAAEQLGVTSDYLTTSKTDAAAAFVKTPVVAQAGGGGSGSAITGAMMTRLLPGSDDMSPGWTASDAATGQRGGTPTTTSITNAAEARTNLGGPRQEEDKERGGGGSEDDTSGVGVMSTHANTVAERTIVAEETPAVVERPKLSIYDDWEGDDDDDFGGVI